MPIPTQTKTKTTTWVPMAERDSAYWIIKHTYRIRVPNIQTMSAEYLRHFGFPTSGDAGVDRQMRDEIIEVRWSIARMAEAYSTGAQLSFPDSKVTKEVYERIHTHLSLWKEVIEDSVNPGNVPYDDLIKLDEFAAAIHPHARQHFDRGFVPSALVRGMSSILSISRASFETPVSREERAAEIAQDKYTGFSDLFKTRKNNGAKRWR